MQQALAHKACAVSQGFPILCMCIMIHTKLDSEASVTFPGPQYINLRPSFPLWLSNSAASKVMNSIHMEYVVELILLS